MQVLFSVLLVVFLLVCVFMVGLILIQRGRGGGLAGAFGGAGGNTAFGSKTGDVLTWATSIVFFIFLSMAVALNYVTASIDKANRARPAEQQMPADTLEGKPAATTPPADPLSTPPAQPPATPPAESPANTGETPGSTPVEPAPQP